MMIWSLDREIYTYGRLSTYKSRLCCHIGQQQWGAQYWETYSLVVSWIPVRSLLVVSKLHTMHTPSMTFTLAFPQSYIKVLIYVYTPSRD